MASLKELLIQKSGLTEPQITEAEEKAKRDSISLMHALEMLDFVSDQKVLSAFASFYNVRKALLSDMDIPKNILDLIPKELAMKLRVIPIDRAGNNIIIATSNPRDLKAIDAIRFSTGYSARPVLAGELAINEAIDKYYSKSLKIKSDSHTSNIKSPSKTTRVVAERVSIGGMGNGNKEDGPIIQLVNDILIQCKQRGASDIHIEPYEGYMRVRLRIDGVLTEIIRPPTTMKGALISRIKIMSGLNIAETRLPQDGAININIGNQPIDFRVSSIPITNGEKIVLRILDKSNLQVDMTQLGFERDQMDIFKTCILKPHGMVLVTGPTGSGKTTTLYSALSELNKEGSNIMTAEDPVEYNLPGINQAQMKPDIGLDFAAALRAFLRQDPDIIMVGEIRDLETANIGMKAALTGHMVISTLHTNSAPDTISRLMNMGVEGFNLVSALSCITAQRLVRKICDRCRTVDESVTPQVLIDLGVPSAFAPKIKAYKGQGCSACGKAGTKGRIAVHEVLQMNDQVKAAILKGASSHELKKVAMATGMRSLRQSAINKLAQGITNIEEVVKTTSPDSDKGVTAADVAA